MSRKQTETSFSPKGTYNEIENVQCQERLEKDGLWPFPGWGLGRHDDGASPIMGQQVTGVPGSPSATTTVDGKQFPAPPSKLGGVIKDNAHQSKLWWPPTIVPPRLQEAQRNNRVSE
jgi:hypothetical protein